MVICRFNIVLRVRVILSAGDVDCSLISGVVFITMALVPRHLEQQSTRRRGLLVSGVLCVSALVPRRLLQRSIHP